MKIRRLKLFLTVFTGIFLLTGGLALKPRTLSRAAEEGGFLVETEEGYAAYTGFSAALGAAEERDGVKTVYLDNAAALSLSGPITVTGAVRLAGIAFADGAWSTDCEPAAVTRAEGYAGALLRVDAGASLTLETLTVMGGEGETAAVEVYGTLRLGPDCTVQDAVNASEAGKGGAVYAADAGRVEVVGGALKHNRAKDGAAVYAEGGATVLISDGAELTTSVSSNVSSSHGGAIAVTDGASLTVSDGKISEEAAVYVFSDAGEVKIARRPAVTGTIFLENGKTADLTDYSGTPLSIEVDPSRPDGPIATRAKNGPSWREIVQISDPVLQNTYFEGYEYTARYLRANDGEAGGEYGYGGCGVRVSQRQRDSLTLIAEFSDGDVGKVSADLSGVKGEFTYEGGAYSAVFALGSLPETVASWQLTSPQHSDVFGALEAVRVDRGAGTAEAPAGALYLTEGGERKPFPETGLIPNDLALEEGVATFYLGEREYAREVYVGERGEAVDLAAAGGMLYDAEITDVADTRNTLTFLGAEGYEYALLADGALSVWTKPSPDGERLKVVFRNLSEDTAYTLLIRRSGTASSLPSVYVEAGSFKSLSLSESAARTRFAEAYRGLLSEGGIRADVRGEDLRSVLAVYAGLEEEASWVSSLPALLEWLEAIKAALPQAFAGDWRSEHAEILAFGVDDLDNTTHVHHKGLAENAVFAYDGMEAHIFEFLGALAEGVEVSAVASDVQELLAPDMQDNIMPKVRRIADIEIEEWLVAARSKYGFAEGTQDNSPQVKALNGLRDRYKEEIANTTGIARADYEAIRRFVDLAKTKLFVQGYYERLLLRKAEAQFSREGLFEALTSVMGGLDRVTEEYLQAEYEAMFALYQSYGKLCLDAYLADASEAMRALYASEKSRIEAYNLTQADDEGLAVAEAWVDLVVKQAETKRELQLYFEGLFDPEEAGRLNANDLRAYDAEGEFEAHFESWFSKIESAEDDGGRASLLQEAERDIYAELASMLLLLHYQSAYGDDAPDGMSQKNGDFINALQASKAEEKGIAIYEDEIERIFANALLELKVLYYYKTTFADTMPAEEALEAVYAAIEEAGKADVAEPMSAAKKKAAYEGMLSLYKAYAALVVADLRTSYQGVPTLEAVLGEAEAALEEVAFGELPYEDASLHTFLQPGIDGVLEEAREKLEVRKYYEALLLRARPETQETLSGVLQSYVGSETFPGLIHSAETAAEKRAAGYQGKLTLYKFFRTDEFNLHFDETYGEVPAERLSMLRELATATTDAISSCAYEGTADDEQLAALERVLDGLAASGRWKLALFDAYSVFTEEGGAAANYRGRAELTEALQQGYAAIDEATMSQEDPFETAESAGYSAMLSLYRAYGACYLEDLKAAYPAFGELLAQAEGVLGAVGPAEDRAALEAAMGEIDALLADTEASLLLRAALAKLAYIDGKGVSGPNETHLKALEALVDEAIAAIEALGPQQKHAEAEARKEALFAAFAEAAYQELTERYPVSGKAFSEIAEGDLPALQEAVSAFEGITMSEETLQISLYAFLAEKAPGYQNGPQNAFLLMLKDKAGKAELLAHRAKTLSEIAAYLSDYAAEGDLVSTLQTLRAQAQAAAEAVVYLAYGEEGGNPDPSDGAYCEGLKTALDDLLRKFEISLENAIGESELEAFFEALCGELDSYALSRLKDVAKEGVFSALEAAKQGALAQLSERTEGNLAYARAALLTLRKTYAEAVVAAYAEVLGADPAPFAGGEDDAACRHAMFEALLQTDIGYAGAEAAAYPEFYEEARARIQTIALEADSDAALKSAEDEAASYLEAAREKSALSAFYAAFREGQGFGEALAPALTAAYGAIDSAPLGEKEAAKEAGAASLAKEALARYAALLQGVSPEELAAAQTAIEKENADTMSAAVCTEEGKWLLSYAQAALAEYTPEAGASPALREAMEAHGRELVALVGEIEEDIAAPTETVFALLGGLPAEVLGFYQGAVSSAFAESPALKDVADKCAALCETANDASAAHAGALTLLGYAAQSILAADLHTDDGASVEAALMAGNTAAQARIKASPEEGERMADFVARTAPAVFEAVRSALTAAQGERLILKTGYENKPFEEVEASDLAALEKAAAAYASASEAVKAYLDTRAAEGYEDFGEELADRRAKAAFEVQKAETLAAISGLGESESEFVTAEKEKYSEAVSAFAYSPAPARLERDPEKYLASCKEALSGTLASAVSAVAFADKKTAALEELAAHYASVLSDPFVLFDDAGKAALQKLYQDAAAGLSARDLSEEARLESDLKEAEDAISRATVVAVSAGMHADGSGAGEAEAPSLSGYIENAGGMSGMSHTEMQLVNADAPEEVSRLSEGKVLKYVLDVRLEDAGAPKDGGVYIVHVYLTKEMRQVTLPVVIAQGAEGAERLETRVEGDFLVFETTHFSAFYVYGEREVDLRWLIAVLTGVLVLELGLIVYLAARVYRKRNAEDAKLLSCAWPLLAVLIPQGAAVVCIVLAALIAAATVALAVLCYLLRRKPRAPAPAEEPEAETTEEPEEKTAEEPETETAEPILTVEPSEEELIEPVSTEEPAAEEPSEPVSTEEPVAEEPSEPVSTETPIEEAPTEEAPTEEAPVAEEPPEPFPARHSEPLPARHSERSEESPLPAEVEPSPAPVNEPEPVAEPEPIAEESLIAEAVSAEPAHPVEAEMPEEYRLPVEELRVEVTANEVNALMQDTVAKTLIEEGPRLATRGKTGIVNVDTLGEYFENGERVTLEELKKRVPYFNKKTTFVKVLARGKLAKALIVEGDDFSLEAVKMIALTGGHVIRTRRG